jgi:LuxR family maltose regulon positive regulatory protein
MVLTGQLEAVEPHLQTVEQALKTDPAAEADTAHLKGEISTIRAAMAYFRRDMAPAIELFNQALALLSPDNLFLRGAVLHTLGAAYSWQGNVSQASRIFVEAANVSQATGNLQVTLIALGSLAQMQLEQGHLRQAGETYQEALQRLELPAEAEQANYTSTAARLYIGLAELLYHRNELEQAQQQLMTGISLAQAEQGSGTLAGGYLLLARLRQAQGNTEEALEAIHRAARLAQQYTGPYYWNMEVTGYQARLWLAQNNLKAVQTWAGERSLWPVSLPETIPYLREGEYLILARLLLAQGKQPSPQATDSPRSPITLAAELLVKIAQTAQETNRLGRLLEVLILQALILQAQAKEAEALAVLDEALSLARAEGYIRVFVDEGPAMANLLRQAKTQSLFPEYVARLISAFSLPSAPPIPLLDPLSERELEILRLIATGMSNKVLAETLFLTVGTVKWHLNNIYSKLDVRSRTHAVARARELGLL